MARTTRRQVNTTALDNLRRVGALTSLGVGAKVDDATQFEILGLCLNKPKAMKGCKPKHVGERTSNSGWRHLGLHRSIDFTEGRSSVSKMFWIPPTGKLELKASPWANVKCYLLEVVDENGVPMHLMVNEDKDELVKLMKFLHEKGAGCVICADGMVRLPFVQNGLTGFRFFGITGAYNDDPQIWHLPAKREAKYKRGISALDKMKRSGR